MRRFLRVALTAAFICAPGLAAAQAGVEIVPRGADTTLDVGSWNLFFFGASEFGEGPVVSDATQLDRVEAVIDRGEIDLWAFQEVVDVTDFNALLDSLDEEGFAGFIGPSVSSNPTFDQRLAFVYDTSVITPLADPTTILAGESFNFAGRLPFELRAAVTVGGATETVRFINIHAKASSDADSYNRRVAAAAALKGYTDALVAQGESVVILGDFNDELTESTRGSSFASPYAAFVADEDYAAATLATEEAGLATFCGSNSTCSGSSTIDHILLSRLTLTFLPATDNPQRQRYGELLPVLENIDEDPELECIGGICQYTVTTSDHLPVVASVSLSNPVATVSGPEAGPVALLAPAPSPFREATALRFRLDAPAAVRLDVVDALGRRVATVEGTYGAGEHAVLLDGTSLAPGVYVVRLQAGAHVRARTFLRVR